MKTPAYYYYVPTIMRIRWYYYYYYYITDKIVNAAARGLGDPGTFRPKRLIISTGPLPLLHAAQTANGTGSQKASA